MGSKLVPIYVYNKNISMYMYAYIIKDFLHDMYMYVNLCIYIYIHIYIYIRIYVITCSYIDIQNNHQFHAEGLLKYLIL